MDMLFTSFIKEDNNNSDFKLIKMQQTNIIS